MFSTRLEMELRYRAWKRRLRIAAVAAAIVAAPFAAFEGWRAYLRLDPEWRFVEDVLLDRRFAEGERMVRRWVTSPEIALVNATPADVAFVTEFVRELNAILEGSGLGVRVVDLSRSNVQIHFSPQASFGVLAKELGRRPPPPSATGALFNWLGDNREIIRAVALVGSDLDDDEHKATIAHELIHCMGIVGHSAAFQESTLFKRNKQLSTATKLSPIDRKLLRFIYMHLRPGAGWWQVRTTYRHAWQR